MRNGSPPSKNDSTPLDPQLSELIAARDETSDALDMLGDVDEEFDDRPTLDDIKVEMGRLPQESSGELVIDAAKKTGTLRAPPWVIFAALAAISFVAWLAMR